MANEAQPNAPSNETETLPGTGIVLPVGHGIETLTAIKPPFKNNAPAWYCNGVWRRLGCAVPQPGRYLQTGNEVIYSFVDEVSRELFQIMWGYRDRKLERYVSKECLWNVH